MKNLNLKISAALIATILVSFQAAYGLSLNGDDPFGQYTQSEEISLSIFLTQFDPNATNPSVEYITLSTEITFDVSAFNFSRLNIGAAFTASGETICDQNISVAGLYCSYNVVPIDATYSKVVVSIYTASPAILPANDDQLFAVKFNAKPSTQAGLYSFPADSTLIETIDGGFNIVESTSPPAFPLSFELLNSANVPIPMWALFSLALLLYWVRKI